MIERIVVNTDHRVQVRRIMVIAVHMLSFPLRNCNLTCSKVSLTRVRKPRQYMKQCMLVERQHIRI